MRFAKAIFSIKLYILIKKRTTIKNNIVMGPISINSSNAYRNFLIVKFYFFALAITYTEPLKNKYVAFC